MIVSALDLKLRMGCTPAWWQLFKALSELENDIICVPYVGKDIETFWWTSYPNPAYNESLIYRKFQNFKRKSTNEELEVGLFGKIINQYIENIIQPKWIKFLDKLLINEKDIDCILFFNIPLTHFRKVIFHLKTQYNIPLIFWEGDMPVRLPNYADERGLLNYFYSECMEPFNGIIVNSEGVIKDIEKLGNSHVEAIHYAADPSIYFPEKTNKNIDVFFYAHGSKLRENWMLRMITKPSKQNHRKFVVAGTNFNISLGKSKIMPILSLSSFKTYCNKSKINLNITRKAMREIYKSSTARLFELAALKSFIISCPSNGINDWFLPNEEIIIVDDKTNIFELYEYYLDNTELRNKISSKIYTHFLKEHTYHHRGMQLLNFIKKVSK